MMKYDTIFGPEVAKILEMACHKQVNIAVSIRHQNRWVSFLSRMVGWDGGHLKIHEPPPTEGLDYQELLLGPDCNLNFRHNNHRYFFIARLELEQTNGVKTLTMSPPTSLERQERRVLERVDVPSKSPVRATIWASASMRPIWMGSVLNINVSGFQMRTPASALNFFELGDRVAVELSFGPEMSKLQLEAHFRYGQRDGNMAMLGMEFIPLGPDATPEIRETFLAIAKKVEEFRQAAG